jgi:L-iditol 2-dehydrogenase
MKALVLKAYKHFAFEDVPMPVLQPDEVLVRVRACGVCGSDVHGMDGSSGRRIPPIIMGHEAAGDIADIGPRVNTWRPGDRVTFDSTVYCGDCWFCRRGQINLCDNRRVLGVSCADYRRHGAFAEYVAVPQRILYRLPDRVTYEQAAIVEALSVAVHAVERADLPADCTALVVGVGMIGLLIVQVLRVKGCRHIIAADVDLDRLALASRLGATDVLNTKTTNTAAHVRQKTGDRGVDVAFEVVGLPMTVKTALESVRKGGSITLVGNLTPQVELPLQLVVTREITLRGTCASAGEYLQCLDLIADGKVDVGVFVSATPPLAEGGTWFERLYAAEPGLMKVILKP